MKTFSFSAVHTIAPMAIAVTHTWRIEEPNRTFKLKNFKWLLDLRENGTDLRLPNATQTTQWDRVGIRVPAGLGNLTNNFTIVNLPLTVNFNGDGLYILEPGNYEFASLIISNRLDFEIIMRNRDAIITTVHQFTMIAEIEIIQVI